MSVMVFPLHDPKGIETPFLQKIIPLLKENFEAVFVSVTPRTEENNPEVMNWLMNDKFFQVNFNEKDSQPGDHFLTAYENAVKLSEPNQSLHLGTSDRLIKAMIDHPKDFLADIKAAETENIPTMFIRSKKAWATHPINYYAAESAMTRVGEILFGKTLDFAWNLTTIKAKLLKTVLTKIKAHDFLIFGEITYILREEIQNKEVDWLDWEDPLILNREAKQLKKERESDPKETEKRLNYVVPIIKYLIERDSYITAGMTIGEN